jgi:hypothetical protein
MIMIFNYKFSNLLIIILLIVLRGLLHVGTNKFLLLKLLVLVGFLQLNLYLFYRTKNQCSWNTKTCK